MNLVQWDVADTKLLINSEGCGYPPRVNCTEFAKRYGYGKLLFIRNNNDNAQLCPPVKVLASRRGVPVLLQQGISGVGDHQILVGRQSEAPDSLDYHSVRSLCDFHQCA